MFTNTAQLGFAQDPGKTAAHKVKGKVCWLLKLLTSTRGQPSRSAHSTVTDPGGAPNDNAL